jgi:glycosyltransferase involved in cell wall biosynthesis
MIDLIIPYYNNPNGLKRTLESINTNIFYVTIIDDNSD